MPWFVLGRGSLYDSCLLIHSPGRYDQYFLTVVRPSVRLSVLSSILPSQNFKIKQLSLPVGPVGWPSGSLMIPVLFRIYFIINRFTNRHLKEEGRDILRSEEEKILNEESRRKSNYLDVVEHIKDQIKEKNEFEEAELRRRELERQDRIK